MFFLENANAYQYQSWIGLSSDSCNRAYEASAVGAQAPASLYLTASLNNLQSRSRRYNSPPHFSTPAIAKYVPTYPILFIAASQLPTSITSYVYGVR